MEDYKIRTKGLADDDKWTEGFGFWTYDGLTLSVILDVTTMKITNFVYSVSEKKWNTDSSTQLGVKELYHTTAREARFVDKTWRWRFGTKTFEVIFHKDYTYSTNNPTDGTPLKDLPAASVTKGTWTWDIEGLLVIYWKLDPADAAEEPTEITYNVELPFDD